MMEIEFQSKLNVILMIIDWNDKPPTVSRQSIPIDDFAYFYFYFLNAALVDLPGNLVHII